MYYKIGETYLTINQQLTRLPRMEKKARQIHILLIITHLGLTLYIFSKF